MELPDDADNRVLDALLEHLAGHQELPLRRRVDGVLRALRDAPVAADDADSGAGPAPARAQQAAVEPAQPARRAPRRRGLLQLAAVVFICLGVYTAWPAPQTAEAVLDQALLASEQPLDRRYAVTVFREQDPGLHFELDVQGARRCVLRGDKLTLGLDGQQAWCVPRLGPVLVNPRPVLVEAWLQHSGVPGPFLELSTVLRRLRDRYRLELSGLDGGESPGRTLRGLLRDAEVGAPQRIELVADAASGAVRQLQLCWDPGSSPWGLVRIELELQGAPELPEDWYLHTAHHAPDRAVLVLNP